MIKLFFFLIGYGFNVIGIMYIIFYLNLLTIGYNLLDYVNFIFRRIECLYAIIGIFIIVIILFSKRSDSWNISIMSKLILIIII